MEYIRAKNLPDELAKEAYAKGFFVEAIQILHTFIENQCRSFLGLIGSVYFNAKSSDTWDLTDSISFNNCIKVLFILNQITREEYEFHKSLNALRNKVIHNIYKEPYDIIYEGIPKKDYDKIFLKTLDQIYFFTRKCENIIKK